MKKNPRVVAIIQARTGSTRLPGKVLMPIVGKPVLWHIVNRLKYCRNIDAIVVATTNKISDKPIIETAKEIGVDAFAGSEEDVLDRYYQAAKKFCAKVVVRITADCPLLDPKIVDTVIDYYLTHSVDYVNTGPSFPEGVDNEVFSFDSLKKAWENAKKPFEREHVSIYIHEHPEIFEIATIENDIDLSQVRFSVDRLEDIIVVRKIFENLYREGEVFHLNDVLNFLQNHPEIKEINKEVPRNEGFISSLKKEGMDVKNPNAPFSEWVSKYSSKKENKPENEK